MPWLHRIDDIHVRRASPSDMATRYPNDAPFVDGDGKAISNANWILKLTAFDFQNKPISYWQRQAFPDNSVTLKTRTEIDAIDNAVDTVRQTTVDDEDDRIYDAVQRAITRRGAL